MKKGKLLISILSLVLTVGVIVGVMAVSASAARGTGGTISEGDWIDTGLGLVKDKDYAYSFAVVGDTQNLNYGDVNNGSANMMTLYQWLVDNKADKNIQYVMGVGDITQSWHSGYTQIIPEWKNAAGALSLLDGVIDYSLVRGNHDLSDAEKGYFNGVFGIGNLPGTDKDGKDVDNQYYESLLALSEKTDEQGRPMAGFLDEARIEDTYRKVRMGDQKYIIFTLDWHPSDSGDCKEGCAEDAGLSCTHTALGWLNSVLSENSDYTAIITLHSFIMRDGSTVDDIEDVFPYENVNNPDRPKWHEAAVTGGNASPKELWDKVLSKHANVKMLFCGHVDEDNIITTQLRGDNGNTVTCMLIDGQTIDSAVEPAGLVAICYMSADGNVVSVEYISTVRAKAGKPAYLRDVNQIKDLSLNYDGWTETAYGPIPTEIYNKYTFHVMLDDDSDPATVNTLYGSYNTWDETLARVWELRGISALAAREAKTYNIIMTRDYTFEKTGNAHNQSCNNPSDTVFDLCGHTFTLASGTSFLPYYTATRSFRPSFSVINGDVVMMGSSKMFITQHGHPSNAKNGYVDLYLKDLDITYASGATGSVVTFFAGSDNGPSYVNIDAVNCNIDASAAGAVTVFNFNDTKNNSNVLFTMRGGSIKGSTVANTTLFTENYPGDRITFAPHNGAYTTVSYSENAKLGGVFYSEAEDKYLEFSAPTENNGVYTSSLVTSGSIATPYGTIPAEYADTNVYPFAFFKDGEMITAFSDWGPFINNNGNTYKSGYTVLLRRDYSTSEATANPWGTANIDDWVIDLGGNTVTRGTRYLFSLASRNATPDSTVLKVINGSIVSANTIPPIVVNNDSKSTSVDEFDLTFEGITFDLTAGYGLIASYQDGGTGCGTKARITFNDCTFDRGSQTKAITMLNLKDKNSVNRNDISIDINGGKLVADSLEGFTLADYDSARTDEAIPDKLFIGNGSDGAPFRVLLPSGYEVPAVTYKLTEGNHMLSKTSETGNSSYYSFVNVATPHGDLKLEYLDVQKNPFVVFKNGEAIHAFSDWYTFIQSTVKNDATYQSGCTLLLRRDYITGTDSDAKEQPSYFCYIDDIKIDLGGNAFIRGSRHMFQMNGYDATQHETTITVENGTIRSAESYPFTFNNNNNNSGVDKFTVICNGITFDVPGKSGIVACYKDGNLGLENTIILNDCVINRGSSTSTVTLFSLHETAKTGETVPQNKIDVSVIINGGSLNSSSLEGLTFASFSDEREAGAGSPDSVSFGTADGKAFTVRVTKGYAIPDSTFAFLGDAYSIEKASEDGSYDYYTVTSLITPPNPDSGSGTTPEVDPFFTVEGYGQVPSSFADKSKFPLLLFYNDSFVLGYGNFNDAITAAGALVDTKEERDVCDTVKIVMRADVYTASEYISLTALLGKVVVDLQEFTIYNTAKAFVNTYIDYSKVSAENIASFTNPAEITFMNGTIRNEGTYHMFGFDMEPGKVFPDEFSEYSAKKVTYSFDNVTFGVVNKEIMRNWSKSGEGIDVKVNINDCTFDFTGAAKGLAMFNCTGVDIVYDIKITGETKIIADDLNNHKLYNITANDKLDILGSVTLTQTAATAPEFTFTHANGVVSSFVLQSEADGKRVYRLGENTAYGFIDNKHCDTANYPFVLFDADGTFVNVYASFAEAARAAGLVANSASTSPTENASEVNGADCIILLRRDHTLTSTLKYVANYHNDVIIDLGANTLTSDGYCLLSLDNTAAYAEAGEYGIITIKNGAINYNAGGNSASIIRANGKVGTYPIRFNGLTIRNTNTASTNVMYVAISTSGTSTSENVVKATFTDCVFDYTEAQAKCYMLGSGSSLVKGKIEASLENCTVLAGKNAAISLISTTNSAQGFAFYQGYSEDVNVSTSNDTLTTDKELKYVLTEGEPTLDSVYANVNGVDCVLKRASADGDTVCYKLYPKALLGYNINTSVSLWSNLVYNIYVPKIGTHSFTVNGEVPTFSIYTDEAGVEFYHIAISIPAGEALEDIRIRINVISGNTTVPASYTLNVLEYAEAVIAGDHTEVTKTLMKAMLAYAHSAHTYFENTESVSDKLARIDALLADYEAPMPEIKESKTPTASYFDTVEIHLGAVPSFRFYLGSGYTKDNFTFASGGKSVSVKAGTGSDGKAYLEIAMYAYMMLDDVTYTVNGTDITEAYNIFSYLDYAENTLKDESVVEIVKALMRYSECAARYRAEILADKTA